MQWQGHVFFFAAVVGSSLVFVEFTPAASQMGTVVCTKSRSRAEHSAFRELECGPWNWSRGWKGSRPGLPEGNVSQGQWSHGGTQVREWRVQNAWQHVQEGPGVVLALGQADEMAEGLGHQLLTALSSQLSTRAIS